jgi:probable phosphoglycerate mutase
LIFLIRHGQTDFNRDRRLQGRLDSRLTELGMDQARRMAETLRPFVAEHPDWTVIASPSGRTRHTARIVCETLGLGAEVEIEPRIAEVDVGRWEGLGAEDIEAAHPGLMGQPGWLCQAPGGECLEDLSSRLGEWLAEIDETDGRRRIVVSHGIAGRVLRWLYAKAAPDNVWTSPSPPQDAVFRLHGGVVGRIDA